ncbi:hypothetical protein [Actinomadura sp. NTSP31]|uniref:hypothetical protein n=1 Tax=Actinomadura sp. NTSP31 TaxID=1735447 RepID=UPI0035C1F855
MNPEIDDTGRVRALMSAANPVRADAPVSGSRSPEAQDSLTMILTKRTWRHRLPQRRGAPLLGVAAAVAAAAAVVPILQLTADHHAAPTTTPSPGPRPTAAVPAERPTTAARPPSRSAAIRELQDFLDSWRKDGYVRASRTYLVPDQQAASDADAPVLTSGRVANVRSASRKPDGDLVLDKVWGASWTPDNGLLLYADLELKFRGNRAAWGKGINSRFVTFTPNTGAVPFVMDLATGP